MGRGDTLTGPAALSFQDIAGILSEVLGRPIQYRPQKVCRFDRQQRAHGVPLGMALVMPALYTVQTTGHAADVTDDVARIRGWQPTDFRRYAQRQKAIWATI